jgi:hypothetical protein
LDWSGSGYGPVEGSCEHDNEPLCAIECLEFLEYLHNLWLLKKGSVPWVSEWWSSCKVPEAFICNAINSAGLLNFRDFINFCRSHSHILSEGLSTASSRAWTLASTCHSWFSSHKSCSVNWFSKQSAIAVPFSRGRNFRPKEPWIAVGALGPPFLMRYFAMGHITWGVTSQLFIFVSHRSSPF